MSMSKSELIAAIIDAEAELADNVNAFGFDWKEAASRCEALKRELADRFGIAVGYGGIRYKIEGYRA